MEKHIAIYARVSTKRQDLRSQLPDLKQWQKAHENGIPVLWYKDKFSGKVQSVESGRLWLTLKRGSGQATIPLRLAECTDETIFEFVAGLHGEKNADYLIPLGVLFTYRGQLDVARQHFDLATERGISTDPWLEKMEWMRKNRPQ